MSPSDPKRGRNPLAEFRALSARIDALLEQQAGTRAANSAPPPSNVPESELRLAKAGARTKLPPDLGDQDPEQADAADETAIEGDDRRRVQSGS